VVIVFVAPSSTVNSNFVGVVGNPVENIKKR
jgi:hypothetical protein